MKKEKIEICCGTSCHLMGSFDLYQVVEQLEAEYKQYLELISVSCLGNCGKGPNVRYAGQTFSQVTPEQLKALIKKRINEGRDDQDGEK